MKKNFLAVAAALVMVTMGVNAQEITLLETGNDNHSGSVTFSDFGVSTSYLWRGQELGGLNLQGDLSLNYESGDFSASIGTWFVHAFQEYIYGPFMKRGYQEWDLYASVSSGNTTITVSDYMMPPYFKTGLSGEGHALDLTLEHYFGDNFPLTLQWNTIVAGGDDVEKQAYASVDKRFYSSYAEASYDFNIGEWPIDFTASVGFIPWKSLYIDSDPYIKGSQGAHFAWLGLRAGYNIPFRNSDYTLPVSTTLGFNPTDGRFLWSIAIGF